ncbi:MAG: nucleotidyltransferase family protein [Candidatus Aenigmarchaeota archaeon]|nr:nucleotidyltransferase family protein [Candidatus Aenigmarchaeota archaeon]
MKHKIAISIDSHLLEKIDSLSKTSNRSHVIESLLIKTLKQKKINNALVLAGGRGAKLRPITYEIPKPIIPVKGKPVLKWQSDILRKSGINNIFVAVSTDVEKIKKEVGNNLCFIEEKTPNGTGGAILLAKKHLQNEDFLVSYCDTVYNKYPNLNNMFDFHIEQKPVATMLLMPTKNKMQGIAKLSGNKITEFNEKPKNINFGLISAGFFIFSPEIFDFLKSNCSMENDVFPLLASKGKLAGYVSDGEFFDIGTYQGYENAIKNWDGY